MLEITGFGRSAISEKSAGLSAKPKSNISNVSIGSTIKIVFILGIIDEWLRQCQHPCSEFPFWATLLP